MRGGPSLAGSGRELRRIAYSRHGPWNPPLSRRHLEYIPFLFRTEGYLDQQGSARRTAKNRRFKVTPGCSNGILKITFPFHHVLRNLVETSVSVSCGRTTPSLAFDIRATEKRQMLDTARRLRESSVDTSFVLLL